MAEKVLSSPQARDELSELLRRDLLGPWDGPHEVFGRGEDRSPRDRYILGLLAPADVDDAAADHEDPAQDDGDMDVSEAGDEGSESGMSRVQGTRFFPSSMGMSFAVEPSTEELLVRASWGRYERVPATEVEEGADERTRGMSAGADEPDPEDGSAKAAKEGGSEPLLSGEVGTGRVKKVWRRIPVEPQPVVIDVTADGATSISGERVDIRWRVRDSGGLRLVSVWLVNQQSQDMFPRAGGDAPWLFQSRFAVTAIDEAAAVFVPRGDMDAEDVLASDSERRQLEMLYRNVPEYAVGHGVATEFEEPPEQETTVRRAWRLSTQAFPTHDVPQTVAPEPSAVPGLEGLVLDMSVLAAGTAQDAVAGLRPLVSSYRDWLHQQHDRIMQDPSLARFAGTAQEQLAKAHVVADRIEAGLDLLASDTQAWTAFRFANEAMSLQRQHIEAAQARRANPDLSWKDALAAADTPEKHSWRPFQIAFVLLNLPALTHPGHDDRSAAPQTMDDAIADLLFFPTGGGKTEAYLGLTAYAFAIRRLQGVIAGTDPADTVDGRRGVAVLMRYTLRLLTAQQFQRAAALVCAAEVLRRKSLNSEVTSLGNEPFTLGLWVGGSVTPNGFDEAEKYVKAKRGQGNRADAFSTSPVPLRECPWCGSRIDVSRDIEANKKTRRIVIYCGDTTGTCEFTNRRNAGHGLPVVAVDEQIYREPPSLLIATVDKFAQLPWNGATAHLFGRVSSYCERHGYRSPDAVKTINCEGEGHRADPPNLPAARTMPTGRLRPPDLVIQDELHLISGALGTMVGLYETAIDALCTWNYQGAPVRAKVVASTATIRRASEQGWALFRRTLAVFPPPVIDIEDSFFARQLPVTESTPGRCYLGVMSPGLRLKSVEIRVTAAVMGFAQMLFDQNAHEVNNPADPYMTLVAFFNALRELGGMRRLVDDDVRARLDHPNHPQVPRRYLNHVEELTSRVPSDRIPDTLQMLDVRFGPEQSTPVRKARAEERKASRGKKAEQTRDAPWPVDVLLATNMFAVGVDVSRLGLMSVTGMPKSTAEYIQATSRVGRDANRPGLILTIFNWARPRDLSHYERFGSFHAAFYQQVEALSVTPFSLPALERGLTGAFIGALRNLNPDVNPDDGLESVNGEYEPWQDLVELFAARAAAVTSDGALQDEVRHLLDKRLRDLDHQRAMSQHTETLTYRRQGDGKRRVLRQPDADAGWGKWTAPNSLRETEPDINLVLFPDDPATEQGDLRAWSHPSVTHSGLPQGQEGN